MSDNLDLRHIARALALQELFTKLESPDHTFDRTRLLEVLEVDDYDKELTDKIVEGVTSSLDKIDDVITLLAPTWPINQIAPVDLCILRQGIWEGFLSGTTPAKVVINECIELAKEFGGPNSSSFVNGVLGTLLSNKDLCKQLNPNISIHNENSEGIDK